MFCATVPLNWFFSNHTWSHSWITFFYHRIIWKVFFENVKRIHLIDKEPTTLQYLFEIFIYRISFEKKNHALQLEGKKALEMSWGWIIVWKASVSWREISTYNIISRHRWKQINGNRECDKKNCHIGWRRVFLWWSRWYIRNFELQCVLLQ